MSRLQSAWDNYSSSCVCGYSYDGANAAHYLSNALIKAGFSELDLGVGADMRKVNSWIDGIIVCRSGRPIQAMQLRDWFAKNWNKHSTPPRDGLVLVYNEKGGYHGVVLKKYEHGKCTGHQGTDHADWPIQEYYY